MFNCISWSLLSFGRERLAEWKLESTFRKNLTTSIIKASISDDRISSITLKLAHYTTQHPMPEELLLFSPSQLCQLSYIAECRHEHLKVLLTLRNPANPTGHKISSLELKLCPFNLIIFVVSKGRNKPKRSLLPSSIKKMV